MAFILSSFSFFPYSRLYVFLPSLLTGAIEYLLSQMIVFASGCLYVLKCLAAEVHIP